MPDRLSLTALRDAVQGCRGCPLYANATQAVFGEGTLKAEVMLVGEQPGDQEDLAGAPFVGPAGKLLDRALEEAGHRPRARPTSRTPSSTSSGRRAARGGSTTSRPGRRSMACRPWLEAELALVKPRALVLLGATAAQALLGRSFKVTQERGRPLDSALAELVVATIHPSAVLRAENREEMFAGLVDDLRVVITNFRPAE